VTQTPQLRVLQLNLFARHGEWERRRDVLRAGLRTLQPDLLTLQEVVTEEDYDQALDLLGPTYHVVHQSIGLIGDGHHHGASLASRWPIRGVHEVDLHLTDKTAEYSCGAVIAEVAVPAPFDSLLLASHGNFWPLWAERERELQAVAVVQQIDSLIAEAPVHVIVGGDMNAEPDAGSSQFWTGRRSLDGLSTAYRDCWESVHGSEPGFTLDPDNPLTHNEQRDFNRGRRIDYLLVRCHAHGPTLRIDDCQLVLNEPIGDVWPSDHFGVIATLSAQDQDA
jgi:endonuclease/exonuclease/phosphatase family metal-dependent hydrolase